MVICVAAAPAADVQVLCLLHTGAHGCTQVQQASGAMPLDSAAAGSGCTMHAALVLCGLTACTTLPSVPQ
jgi:hypothetical protein